MKRYKNVFGISLLILACVFVISGVMQFSDKTYATAVGTVKTSGTLAVRKGAGKKYAIVKQNGKKVTLKNGKKVTILAQKGKWYKIRFTSKKKKITGYVYAKYLTVMSGDVCTSITGVVSPSSINVRTKASYSGSPLMVGNTVVKLKHKAKVTVLSETIKSNAKWYRVKFTYNKKTKYGYLPSVGVKVSYLSGIPGIVKNSSGVVLKKKAGSAIAVKMGASPIALAKGVQMLVLSEKTVNGIKYVKIDVTINKKVYSGYIEDYTMNFQQVEVLEPDPTARPKSTAKAKSTAKPKATPTKKPSATAKPVSDAQFKANLKSQGFPSSYITPLMALHKSYPKWSFKINKVGLDWSTVIQNESKVGLNLLSINKPLAWKSTEPGAYNASTNTFIPFDGTTWVTASEMAVKYYMDPRNFLTDSGIFMFESLEYQKGVQTQTGVENILKNTPMYKSTYTYAADDGTSKTITYSKTYMQAAASSGVSPYHLASRVKQEVVTSSTTMSNSVTGTYSGHEGIYNFYNIGANDSAGGGAVAKGLTWAAKGDTYLRPWNNQYKSLVGGAQYIGQNYINVGQNTLYLQKFNVTKTSTYNHQYMSNIDAPNSESIKNAYAYGDNKTNMSFVFSIPVYNNMPGGACPVPSGTGKSAAKSTNNYLKTLKVKGYAFTPKFKSGADGSKTYKITVPNTVQNITIAATKTSSSATLSGTGKKKVNVGSNTYVVKVRSESGSTRKYKIKVTRKKQ